MEPRHQWPAAGRGEATASSRLGFPLGHGMRGAGTRRLREAGGGRLGGEERRGRFLQPGKYREGSLGGTLTALFYWVLTPAVPSAHPHDSSRAHKRPREAGTVMVPLPGRGHPAGKWQWPGS